MVARIIMVALIAVVLCFEVFAIVQVARSRLEHKWRWILFCLVGAAEYKLAWTSGLTGYNPFTASLLGFAVDKTGSGPWIVSVSFPIGALLALRKTRSTDALASDERSVASRNSSKLTSG